MFLSKREQALLQLLLVETDYLPAAFFQKKLFVSTKTIYNDLAHLEEKLQATGLHIARLPSKGVRLEGNQENREQAAKLLVEEDQSIDRFSPEYRKVFIFANYLFAEKPWHYQEFAEYFFVSFQSIKKDVDELILFCHTHQVQGEMTETGLVLEAAESARQRVFKNLLDYYLDLAKIDVPTIQKLFKPEHVIVVETFVSELSVSIGRQINSYFVDSLKISLAILLARSEGGHSIEEQDQLIFDELKRMKLYMEGIAFSNQVTEELGFQLTDEDVQYVCSLLLAHGIEPYVKLSAKDENMLAGTKQIIQNMSDLLGVDLTADALLLQALLSHIVPMVHRLQNHIYIKNPLRETIKKQYSTMFTLTKFAIADFEKEFSLALTEDEVTFLTIHFQLAFEKIRTTNHVLIVCSSGLATSELIFNRIKQTISADVILEITSLDRLAHTSLTTVDLIISTIPLEGMPVEVIYVSALPTPEEVANISARVSNLSQSEKSFHSKEYQNPDLLQKYIDPEFLYVKQEFQSKEEILTFFADSYQARGLVTPAFKTKLFEREELGSTGLKTGVAIPHADPKTVNQTKLAFMSLASPIKWGVTSIQLVILLAIAEEDLAEAKELIASIYDLFQSSEEIAWIVASQNSEELYQRLLKGGKRHVF